MRSELTAGMPHMTASTARRSIVRRANSSAEKVCEAACCANPTRANPATNALNIAPLLSDQPIPSAGFESVTALRDRLREEAARAVLGQIGRFPPFWDTPSAEHRSAGEKACNDCQQLRTDGLQKVSRLHLA